MKKLLLALLLIPSLAAAANWECIIKSSWTCDTMRLKIPQGWIVKVRGANDDKIVFVPDKNHEWSIN